MESTTATLANKVVLLDVTTHMPTFTRQHKSKTEEVSYASHAETGLARLTVTVFPPKVRKDLAALLRSATQYVDAHSLRWRSNGVRMIPAKSIRKVIQKLDATDAVVRGEVANIMENFDSIMSVHVAKLGDLADGVEIPTRDEVERAYGISYTVLPLPREDALAGLIDDIQADSMETVKTQYQQQLAAALASARCEIIEKLRKPVLILLARLRAIQTTGKGALHASLLENISMAADAVEALNSVVGLPISTEIQELRALGKLPQNVLSASDGLPVVRADVIKKLSSLDTALMSAI